MSECLLPQLDDCLQPLLQSLHAQLARWQQEAWTPGRLQVGRFSKFKLSYRAPGAQQGARCELSCDFFRNPHPPAASPAQVQLTQSDGPNFPPQTDDAARVWLSALFDALLAEFARLQAERRGHLIDFALHVWLDIDLGDGLRVSGRRLLIDEAARLALLARQNAFDGSDLEDDPQAERTLSCFAGNLFDDLLAPLDVGSLPLRLYFLDLIASSNPAWHEHWQATFDSHAETWLVRWFKRWFKVTGLGMELGNYRRLPDAGVPPAAEGRFASDTLLRLLRRAASYQRPFLLVRLQLLAQLGVAEAHAALEDGGAVLPPALRRLEMSWGRVLANDVRGEVSIELFEDTPLSFAGALQQLIALFEADFPRNYQLIYASRTRSLLPVADLADNGTHHFFADALAHIELHPLLARYADAVMQRYAWYTDCEPGGQELMPSSYAVFGLALASPAAAGLLRRYCELVDGDHQPATTRFLFALLKRYGLAAETLPMLVDVALNTCYIDDFAEQAQPLLQDGDRARLEAELARRELDDYELEHVRYVFFGEAGLAA